jgi:hypothetical protein
MVPHTAEVSATMRLAYVVESPAGDFVVVDGVRGRPYTDINTTRYIDAGRRPYITFSADGRRFAYAAKQRDAVVVVVDGVAGPPLDNVFPDFSLFSADSRHVAYFARRAGKYVVVRDGVVGPAYDAVHDLTFLSDNRLVYIARRGNHDYLVMDGKEMTDGERILGPPAFNATTNRLAYKVVKGDSTAVVVDGAIGKAFREIGLWLHFTGDGRRFLYEARDSLHYVVVDGVQGRGYPFIEFYSYGFSESGGHYAYIAIVNDKRFWVLDGNEGKHYDRVDLHYRPQFVGDGSQLTYSAKEGGQSFVVIGSKESEPFDQIETQPYVSGGHVLYVATRGTHQYVGVDTTVLTFDQVAHAYVTSAGHVVVSARRGPVWSVFVDGVASGVFAEAPRYVIATADGQVAYMARRDGKEFVVFDGVEGKLYDELGQMALSRDGRHVAYGARRVGRWVIVVDGAESQDYDEILAFPRSDGAPANAFTVLARRGQEDFRVTVHWPR